MEDVSSPALQCSKLTARGRQQRSSTLLTVTKAVEVKVECFDTEPKMDSIFHEKVGQDV